MAAIPFYIVLGDAQINGPTGLGLIPQPGNSGTYWTNFRNRPLLMQTVPTSGSAYLPWWDGTAGEQIVTNAATSNTCTISPSPGWTPGEHIGRYITVDGGVGGPVSGVAQRKLITGNTADTVTISGAWTTNPTASAVHINTGKWCVYDHVRGADNPLKINNGQEGDNWYANQGGGVGFTASLMQLLKSYHPSGFKLFKRANLGATSSWADGQANMTLVAAELAQAVAAMAPDTPDFRGVIYWNSTDIATENLTYTFDVSSFITAIRTVMGDTAGDVPVWIVNNASQMLQQSCVVTIGALTDVPYAQVLRQANIAMRATVTNLHLLDMEGAEFSADSGLTYATEDADPGNYSTEDHIELGERAFNAIVRYYADAPTSATGTMPVVVMIGDSQGTGLIYPQYAILGGQESILGPTGTVRSSEYVWNDVEQAWEPYDLSSNANTLGASGSLYYGPEAATLADLHARFPDGVAVFKMAQGGASMTTEGVTAGALNTFDPAAGTLWDEMGTAWTAAKLAMIRDLGLVPDVVGAIYLLGDNDSYDATSAAAFGTKLATFNEQVRARFTTRSTGASLPIVAHKPPQHIDNGGQSVLGIGTAKAAVREHLVARAASDSRFVVVSDADLDLLRSDNIHYTGRAQDTLGYRLAQSLLALIDSAASGSGASGGTDSTTDSATDFAGTESPVLGTLVVEDGTGLADAESYLSVAEADARAVQRGNPTEWSTATTAQKQNWLRNSAGAGVDILFGPRWSGYRRTDTQALDWPRRSAGDLRTCRFVSESSVPAGVKHAQFEFALSLALGVDPLRNLDPSDNVERSAWASATTDDVPGGFKEARSYDRGVPIYAVLTRMNAFAAPFLLDDDGRVGLA